MAAGPRSSITPLPAAHYPSPTLYFLAIAFNLVARFAWALRLWMLRAGFNLDTEFSLFALQVLELFRRAVWVFFRFEKQELARRHLL